MSNEKQQSAHSFVLESLGMLQHKILNMLDGAESTIFQLQQQVESLKKEIEELKVKLQSPKE